MKKILLILLSLFCILINPMSMFADELSDLDKIVQGKGGEYKVGDVLTLEIDAVDDGDDCSEAKEAKFLVIGKDEDYKNTLTLMSIEPLTLFDQLDQNIIKGGELSSIKNNLKEGTYSGDINIDDLVGINDKMFFTTKDKNQDLSIDNSTLELFSSFCAETIGSIDTPQSSFEKRVINTSKNYVLEDGTTATITSKFWLPSLKELGLSNEGNSTTYSLFTTSNIMAYLDEKSLDTEKDLKMFTRDINYEDKGVYVIDHSLDGGHTLQTDLYEPVNFGICFTVNYDEEVTEYTNPTGANNVLLYANKPSTYYVTMPKKVYVQSENKTPFNLTVYGEIEKNKKINISMPSSVSLIDSKGRDNINLDVDGTIASIDYNAIDNGKKVIKTVTVTAPKIYAGSWQVNLPVTISLTN